MPACTGDTDLNLAWEGAFGDLAIDRGSGQTGPGKNGFQADDTIWFKHGRAAFCWLFLIAPDPERTDTYGRARGFPPTSYPGLETAANGMGLESNATAPPKLDTVIEGVLSPKRRPETEESVP